LIVTMFIFYPVTFDGSGSCKPSANKPSNILRGQFSSLRFGDRFPILGRFIVAAMQLMVFARSVCR
jgi:hypothetical protein